MPRFFLFVFLFYLGSAYSGTGTGTETGNFQNERIKTTGRLHTEIQVGGGPSDQRRSVAADTTKILGILHSECRRPFRQQITFGKLQSLAHHAVNNPRYQADKRMGGVLASRRRDTGAISISDLSTLKHCSVDDGEPMRRKTTPYEY